MLVKLKKGEEVRTQLRDGGEKKREGERTRNTTGDAREKEGEEKSGRGFEMGMESRLIHTSGKTVAFSTTLRRG